MDQVRKSLAAQRATIAIAGMFSVVVAAADPTLTATPSRTSNVVRLDRAALHLEAVEDSLKPIHPGIPGKRVFWNAKARGFMYAPAFEFKPVTGAARYRYTATAYGTRQWSFDAPTADASLDPVWRELPGGRLLVERVPLDERGNVRWAPEDLPPSRWFVKAGAVGQAPRFDIEASKRAPKYRFTVWAAKELTFEADEPWAPLSPIWRHVPVGEVVLKVEGLDRAGGKPVAIAYIIEPNSAPRAFRRFHRKAVFRGPYHEAVADYRDSAYRWLTWLARNDFKEWESGPSQRRLQGYPSKFIGAAVSGMTTLALMETDPRRKNGALRSASNAAHALIAASFPADWGLGYFPPTYSDEINTVMMSYPAWVGLAYLDLYEVAGDKQILVAARRIADTYRKTQLPDGSWPLLMDARSGGRLPRSATELIPDVALAFFDSLVEKHGFEEYRPMVDAAWRWIVQDTLKSFRLEGQFEDTAREGGRAQNLSLLPACFLAERLLHHRSDNPSYVELAEELLRFAEDQFVIWEQPVATDVSWAHFPRLPFTPSVLEQYAYMVPISGAAAIMMEAYQAAYEATGKEIYLAKAAAFANAMTVIQAANGGDYVGTFWNPGKPGDWPNVHAYAAKALASFGEMLRQRNLRLSMPNRS